MAPQRRASSRSANNLQTPHLPNRVGLPTSSDRSVVSDLTNHSPANVGESNRGIFADSENEDEDLSFAAIAGREIEKDMNGGDGGDSDEEGEECLIHREGYLFVGKEVEKDEDLNEDNGLGPNLERDFGRKKGLVNLTNSTGGKVGNVILAEGDLSAVDLTRDLVGKDIKITQPPKDWVSRKTDKKRDEPVFDAVDNPGDWPEYCFRPYFATRTKTSKYEFHKLPTGAMPVPEKNGKREVNGWEFHYKGWVNEGIKHRRGATTANMFPKEMEGSLDAAILENMGLTKERMGLTGKVVDALFFYQLILPMCNPLNSGIKDDPRKSYYFDVEMHTNASKYNSGQGVSYGHEWNCTSMKELVHFDGVLVRDGVLGGTQGAFHRRWQADGPCYSKHIAKSMTLTRFGELKRSMKLCNNDKCPKRGERKY